MPPSPAGTHVEADPRTGRAATPPASPTYARMPVRDPANRICDPADRRYAAPGRSGRPSSSSAPRSAPASDTVQVSTARSCVPPRVTSTAIASERASASRFATASPHGSQAPDGGTPRWASPGRPRSWRVSSGPGATTSSTAQRGTNRTRSPGASSAGCSSVDVPERRVGPSDQVPPARGLEGVDARLAAGDRDAAGRNPDARRRATGEVERRRDDAEVREAGHEPQDQDAVLDAGVQLHHLVLRQAGPRGHLRQIGSVGAAVPHGDLVEDAVGGRLRSAGLVQDVREEGSGAPPRRSDRGRTGPARSPCPGTAVSRPGTDGAPDREFGGRATRPRVGPQVELVGEGDDQGGVAHAVDARRAPSGGGVIHRRLGPRCRPRRGLAGPRRRWQVPRACRRGCRWCPPGP